MPLGEGVHWHAHACSSSLPQTQRIRDIHIVDLSRPPLIAAGGLFILGGAAMGLSPFFQMLVGGRFVAGMGIGLASSTVPVYISECASSKRRGFLSTFPQLMGSTGILISYLVVLLLMLHKVDWRYMLACSLPLAFFQTFLACSLPETPRWLLRCACIHESIHYECPRGSVAQSVKIRRQNALWVFS